jgi:VanZ family protein
VVLWALVMLAASTNVGSAANSDRALRPFLLTLFPDLPPELVHAFNITVRKSAHVFQFLILALLTWRAMRRPPALAWDRWQRVAVLLVLSVALALASEGIQLVSASRGASWGDVGLDVLGGSLGAIAVWYFERNDPSLRGRR